jgi:hypothetical protein
MVVTFGQLCYGGNEADGSAEVLELEDLLDLVPLPLPVTELVEALLDLFVSQQFGHIFSLGSASPYAAEDTAVPRLGGPASPLWSGRRFEPVGGFKGLGSAPRWVPDLGPGAAEDAGFEPGEDPGLG